MADTGANQTDAVFVVLTLTLGGTLFPSISVIIIIIRRRRRRSKVHSSLIFVLFYIA